MVTLLDALRGHAGAALIISLCVLLSLTVRCGAVRSRMRVCADAVACRCLSACGAQGHGLVASVALEAVAGTPARVLFTAIAMVCIVIAGPVTHGLGGASCCAEWP